MNTPESECSSLPVSPTSASLNSTVSVKPNSKLNRKKLELSQTETKSKIEKLEIKSYLPSKGQVSEPTHMQYSHEINFKFNNLENNVSCLIAIFC